MHIPDFESFAPLAATYQIVPIHRRLLSDTLTPVTALALLDDGQPAALFESVIGGEKVGRYSFLACHPSARLAAYGPTVHWDSIDAATGQTTRVTETSNDPLLQLARRLGKPTVAPLPHLPPFVGGAIGYAGYDVVRYVEKLPHAPPDDRGLPDLDFTFFRTLLVFDNVTKTLSIYALARCDREENLQTIYRNACQQVDAVVEKLNRPIPPLGTPDVLAPEKGQSLPVSSNFTRSTFAAAVEKCVQYIRAGDIFQVVPSQRFTVASDASPFEIYRSLRVVNPSPFMFLLRTPDCTLVGCSPEIMCRVADGVVTVRPLAGTRPRGKTPVDDQRLEAELLADPKERAEHVMLVDLGRNDIGRVAQFGSVSLTEVMIVERYSHVMHISSEVSGRLKPELDAFDALRACLPAGTVSGAPKVRAMEVIDEVEPHRRGPYGGAVGYLDYRGNMDTCIALRTMVVANNTVYVQAGCGVVADSQADAEYEETVNKARAMIRAIEITEARRRPR
jgi:anthranilate synthase component I